MKVIAYADYREFWKDFEIKGLWEYYYLYVQSDTLLLVDAFENLQKMCFEVY